MKIRIKGIPITLDDRTFVLPPASLDTLEELAPRLDALNRRLTTTGITGMPVGEMGIVVDFALACLQRNYPDLERRFVARHIGLENMQDVLQACFDTSGLLRQHLEAQAEAAGQAAAAGAGAAAEGSTLGESTGTASSPTS